MALNRKLDAELEALIQQGVAELRATNPELFEPHQPLSEELIEELERDDAELERIWDEMDRARGNAPRLITGAEAVDLDRGD